MTGPCGEASDRYRRSTFSAPPTLLQNIKRALHSEKNNSVSRKRVNCHVVRFSCFTVERLKYKRKYKPNEISFKLVGLTRNQMFVNYFHIDGSLTLTTNIKLRLVYQLPYVKNSTEFINHSHCETYTYIYAHALTCTHIYIYVIYLTLILTQA